MSWEDTEVEDGAKAGRGKGKGAKGREATPHVGGHATLFGAAVVQPRAGGAAFEVKPGSVVRALYDDGSSWEILVVDVFKLQLAGPGAAPPPPPRNCLRGRWLMPKARAPRARALLGRAQC